MKTKTKKYDVKIFLSGYVSKRVTAGNKAEAVIKARKRVYKNLDFVKPKVLSYLPGIQEVMDTLLGWPDADEAEEVR